MTAAADSANLAQLSAAIIQSGSKSFAAASKLFDRNTRVSAHLLYAWCRHCDDMIDGQELGFAAPSSALHDPKAELAKLREQTADALAGNSMREPVFQAFQAVMQKHGIPAVHAFELLNGFAMDVEGRVYETIDDTLSYCYHVAGVVGVMMAMIMGARDELTLDRASDLGLGFQLTNIARDIVDDAAVGRCYLPRLWLREAGLTEANYAEQRHRPALFGVAERLVETADAYYDSSRHGIAHLPLRSGWAIGTARAVYRKIGYEVLRRGPDAWTQRVSTSKGQKLIAAVTGAAVAVDAKARSGLVSEPSRTGLWTRPKG